MKRMIVIVVCLFLCIPLVVSAEVNVSGMSFDELVALRQQIDIALWSSDEWQAVTVPQGVYEVGVDIPVGHWTITAAPAQYVSIDWGSELDASKTAIDYMGLIWVYDTIYSKSYRYFETGYRTQVDYDLSNGQFVVIADGSAVFSPYTGKPALGFK